MKANMKFFLFFLMLITGMDSLLLGQNQRADSIRYMLGNIPADTDNVKLLLKYSEHIAFFNPDTGLLLDRKALKLSREIHYLKGETEALNSSGDDFHFLGNYPEAFKMQFEALDLNRQIKDAEGEGATLGFIGILYNDIGQYRKAIQYLLPGVTIYERLPGRFQGAFVLSNLADSYYLLGMNDSALFYAREAYRKFAEPERSHLWSFVLGHMGKMYAAVGKNDSALKFYHDDVINSRISNDKINLSMAQKGIADVYQSTGQNDSSLYYAREAYATARSVPLKLEVLQASGLLASLYNKIHKPDSAYLYLDVATAMKDSLYGSKKFMQLQALMLNEQLRQQTIIQQEQQFRNRIKYIALLSALGIFLLVAFLLIRNNRHKQKANNLLRTQKSRIEETLSELRSTQAQLIQSEKMASLGELTAGIAHEIQNPLNFVNNFSEVNTELVDELQNELKAGNLDDAITISNDIKENEEKINHHGKRADAIVKGMLQHSRASSGQKELTDINALADEYLRLAYHGMRAKDKSFNANLKTDFDTAIAKINIVPQEIGRVLLNLYNNAFYAVLEKKKLQPGDYEPTVSVGTKKIGNKIEIKVDDNGNGIPQKVVDKIFQPFFTTKPTGEGTGLGLSLSYDIIKAHGGEIKVETKEGEGSSFIIQLPV
jgi:two-component system, NtrC family, sensor kinase